MLIEFSFENFRSVRERQTLTMVATAAKELREFNCLDTKLPGVPSLVRSAVIYGPNAAGKTNVLRAMLTMQQIVLTSANTQQGAKLNVQPFAFDKKTVHAPSEFEAIFVWDSVRYQYGFAATETEIVREWLIAYPTGKPQQWFHRESKGGSRETEWFFGSKLKGSNKVWRDATRTNALFLSTAVQLNSEQLKAVFNWFLAGLTVVVSNNLLNPALTYNLFSEPNGKATIVDFLRAADLGIDDVEVKRQQVQSGTGIVQGGTFFFSGGPVPEVMSIKSLHKLVDGKEIVPLDFSDESDGTQKLFSWVGGLVRILKTGSVLFIDELDNSLHPVIVRFLIELFRNPAVNLRGAQLIFSTHDTSLLDRELFRRDQIWFVEKDKKRSTKLYPLSEFKPRKEELLEKNYLKGRYGALPMITPLDQ
jgi:AAA15 family ATPase/GTPase